MAKKAKKRTAKRVAGKTKTAAARARAGRKAAKKARGRSRPSARETAKKRAGKKGRKRSLTIAAGTCLDLIAAGEIVQDAIPGGPHDIDSTLEDAGLISTGQRTIFRADVVDGVSARGCAIAAGDVPNQATTTLREARKAVQQNAH